MALLHRLSRTASTFQRADVSACTHRLGFRSIFASPLQQAGADSSDKQSADNRQNFEKEVPPMSPVGQNMEVPTEADPSERAEWVPPQVPKHMSGKRAPDTLETDQTFPYEERQGVKPPPEAVPKEVAEGLKEGPTVVTENLDKK